MKVVQAYRFALDPSPGQERALRSHAGAARFAWNWGLARCGDRYKAERRWYSAAELHKLWNAAKKTQPGLAWWDQNSKCAYQEAFRDLDRALGDFMKAGKGERKGRRLGFPRFKKKGSCRDSFRFSTGAIRCSGAAVTLPRLGAARYETVVAEDLNVAGMARNRRLARAVADQGFGTARRMLGYKTTWNGGTLITADRWFPSSKTCSACGTVKTKLSLALRTHNCEACGLVIDRDANAARNLLALAASGAERRNACGGTVRPGAAGHAPVNQEPGTAFAGKTGTVSRQRETVGSEPTHAY